MVTHILESQKLGQELVRRKLISPADLVEAIRVQKQEGRPLVEVLAAVGPVSPAQLLAALVAAQELPVVDLKQDPIDPAVTRYIPEALARRHRCIPIRIQENTLVVAMADPENLQAVGDLQAQAAMRLQVVLAAPAQIEEAIDLFYKATAELAAHLQDYQTTGQEAPPAAEESSSTAPAVKTLELLLEQAVRERASDVHIEPHFDRVQVRYRVDGMLWEAVSLPTAIHAPLLSRIKILAQMNIAERRLPQDGQFLFKAGSREVDVRVATIESAYGERAVLRLLSRNTQLLGLAELGLLPEALARYRTILEAPHGLILVSGPTGAGKTTTLYASANALDRRTKNIVSIEDPIEYHLPGISQIKVNVKAGLTFAAGVRALMRHDPDVILVGEIRDSDTAAAAVRAALTGHLVLSTIHANDTEGVVYRLMNLEVDPYLMASSVTGIVAQRMVRRVCPDCAVTREAPLEEQLLYHREVKVPESRFTYGQGCQFCSSTGFRGRIGIFEVMTMTEAMRRLVLNSPEPGCLRKQATQEGMTSMLQDGLIKAKQGITTPAEVLANVYHLG
ncbi:MAG: Flp pilus assembly complex ATPase component TadA [Chloroflexi bacterium]|nr:Flp pilus assembly complex ATPase component TadA [Chloroflexota bacterium]